MYRLKQALVILAGLTMLGVSHAAEKALLIGVAEYPDLNDRLPGIDLDIDTMRRVTAHLGFHPENVMVLEGPDATVDGIESAIKGWLSEGVGQNDRVLVYFSGHGSRIPDLNDDEDDGLDEVLLTYDSRRADGPMSLVNVVVDDSFGSWLDSIPSNRITTIVDACHSGTVTRSFKAQNRKLNVNTFYKKSYTYPGAPKPRGFTVERLVRDTVVGSGLDQVQERIVSISAAKDEQEALATVEGSVFTMALGQIVEEAARSGEPITLEDVRDQAERMIAEVVDGARAHNPVVTGSPARAQEIFQIERLVDGNGPRRQELEELVESVDQRFVITANQSEFTVGDDFRIKVEVPASGYLNIVSIDAEDVTTVLYPNAYHGSNHVDSGVLELPTEKMSFSIKSVPPTGVTAVAAFLTAEPINLYKMGLDGRDETGRLTAAFTQLSASATKALTRGLQPVPRTDPISMRPSERRDPYVYSALLFVDIKRDDDSPVSRTDAMRPLQAINSEWGAAELSVRLDSPSGSLSEVHRGDEIAYEINAATDGELIFVRFDSHGNATMSRPSLSRGSDGRYHGRVPERGTIEVTPPLGTDTVFAILSSRPVGGSHIPKTLPVRVPREEAASVVRSIRAEVDTDSEAKVSVTYFSYLVTAPGETKFASSKAIRRELAASMTAQAPIEFDFDTATLSEKSRQELDLFGDALSDGANRRSRVILTGHTDDSGTEEYNYQLAGDRAATAFNYLVTNFGFTPDRFETSSAGKSMPIASNDTEEGRAQNRRVQFTIVTD